MSNQTEIGLRDVTRVICSGTTAYLAVHLLVLPRLVTSAMSFPAYFCITVLATGVLSVLISSVIRAPKPDMRDDDLRPATRIAPRVRGLL